MHATGQIMRGGGRNQIGGRDARRTAGPAPALRIRRRACRAGGDDGAAAGRAARTPAQAAPTAARLLHSRLRWARKTCRQCGEDGAEHLAGAVVGEVPMAAADALFDRPRALRVVLQHLRAMVGLDHQHVGLADALPDVWRGVAEVGEPGEPAPGRRGRPRPWVNRKATGSRASCGTAKLSTSRSRYRKRVPVSNNCQLGRCSSRPAPRGRWPGWRRP